MSKSEVAKLIEINQDVKELEKISTIAQEVLKSERNILISDARAIPTIVYEFLNSAARYLEKVKSKDKNIQINIFDIFDMGVTYRESDDGEKDGNFTPYLQAGQVLKTTIKSDELTEDDE